MPESPRWLAKMGRSDETLTILGDLRADGNCDDPNVQAEFAEIMEIVSLEKENAGRSSYWSMLWGTGMWYMARLYQRATDHARSQDGVNCTSPAVFNWLFGCRLFRST